MASFTLSEHDPLLFDSVLAGDLVAVRRALSRGANPNAKPAPNQLDRFQSPLSLAAEDGDSEIVQELLTAGADPNGTADGSNGEDHPLLCALKNGHTDVAVMLLDSGATALILDENHTTALHYASQCGEEDLVRRLLDLGADPNSQNTLGSTPIHFACLSGSLPVVSILLDAGAQLEIEDDDGTAFNIAAQEQNIPLMRMLASRGANVNCKDANGENVLFWAVSQADAELVRVCIDLGVDVRAKNVDGKTAMHMLITCGKESMTLEALLKSTETGVDNEEDEVANKSSRPFSREILQIIARTLVNAGFQINEPDDQMRRTALHTAVDLGNVDAVSVLMELGADTQMRDKDGMTPLDLVHEPDQNRIAAMLA